jgi:glycosyltransferase involved in cell wall biosynthesis
VAFVVQRYGEGVTGGSESLARAVAERLAGEHRLTVLTTCARDYVTWRNELPAGREELNGVGVERFAVAEERDLEAFNALSEPLYARAAGAPGTTPPSDDEEREWLRRQGPYAPELVEHLRARGGEFDAIVFFTYLYYTTVAGLEAAPARSILIPTAHDEPPLRLRMYARLFAAARGLGFLTGPEEELVRARFRLSGGPASLVGMGVDVPASPPDVETFKIRHDVRRAYLVYAGRIDAGKGCAEMLDFYARYRRECRGGAELLLLGRLNMPEPRVPGARYLGFLSEAEKLAAFAGARAVVCPSPYESLSIVLLEALGLGTPVVASARSAVLADHCRRSNAGLVYASAAEFVEAVDLLLRAPKLRAAMGENGRRYVRDHYAWPALLARWRRLIEAVATATE